MKNKLIIIGSFLILLSLSLYFVYYQAKKELNSPGEFTESRLIHTQENENYEQISQNLVSDKSISTERIFLLYWKVKYGNSKIYPGYYEIPAKASIKQIADIIASGDVKLIKVTIPEGWRVEQIGQRLSSKGIVSYDEFVKEAKPYEGELFPATFDLPPKMEASEIVALMRQTYSKKIASSGLTVGASDLILASIVEREAAGDTDRALIAGIYKNRLAKGMKLEADPTVRFGKDNLAITKLNEEEQEEYGFWNPVKVSDFLSVNSEFNTYINKGLPPSPICNPGLKSLEAVMNPTESNYLYFLHKDGKIYPAVTGEEHNLNRQRILGAIIN